MSDAAVKREPFLKQLSKNVQVLYGWKDAHARVRVWIPPSIPIGFWYPVEIPAEAIVRFKTNFQDAYDYGLKPESERTLREPVPFEAREDCRGRWGYRDAHVELDFHRLKWFTLEFPFEEFKLAKAAMDEAHLWASLPADVRELQGA
jgi:hypothetical protein